MMSFLRILLVALCLAVSVSCGVVAPKPLYRDPLNDGAADPFIIRKRGSGEWYMFYTSRRANAGIPDGVSWAHGTPVGVAVSPDLARWDFLRNASIAYSPDAEHSYWAPSVVDDGRLYHMFLTYVPGVFADWDHPRSIIHLTSTNLLDWDFVGEVELMSDRVIDPEVLRMPDGGWRMWYNQEPGGKLIAYADSPDLYNWTDRGLIEGIGRCEAPSVFRWKDSWWMICDEWKGLAVYRSDDAEHWTRQSGNILSVPGTGCDDGAAGGHCDVLVRRGRAFIFYFTHPDPERPRRSSIQVAELELRDGVLSCDRNASVRF